MRISLSKHLLPAAVLLSTALLLPAASRAQTVQSHLIEVTKSKKLKVCQYPQYYSISFRNPKTGQIEGIDADLAKELAKDLGAELEIVEFELRHLHRRPAGQQM